MKEHKPRSVVQEWVTALPLQQQTVLLAALRGPDNGISLHPIRRALAALRGCVLLSARYGRALEWGEVCSKFMTLEEFGNEDPRVWTFIVEESLKRIDELPHHFVMHFLHATEILGYRHPKRLFCCQWKEFYMKACGALHVAPETGVDMDMRLNDWDQAEWPSES